MQQMMNFQNGQADGDFPFSVERSDPFRVYPILQEVAMEAGKDEGAGVGEAAGAGIIDLSRGDPGYGAAPSVRGREFLSFLSFLDTKLNNRGQLFADTDNGHENQILEEIAGYARSAYVPALAERYLKDLSDFVQQSILMGREQGIEWSAYDVLREIFKYSTVSGGVYHDMQGELLVRVIVAWLYRQTVETPIDYDDLVFTAGASGAIGVLFKLLGQEGIQYLGPGDKVLISSPAYSIYNEVMERRGINVLGISLDPVSGRISKEGLKAMKRMKDVKMIILIDPNNPTGFAMDEKELAVIADFAKKQDALVVTDEVYSDVFENEKSLLDLCPERTLRIHARSKTERSTGLRFGDVLISKNADEYLSMHLLKGHLPEGQSFKDAFICAKGPGGIHGEFRHTTFVPGPVQYLGAAHIVFGGEERQQYQEWVANNARIFRDVLGLTHEGNLHYAVFDLNEVPGCSKKDVPPEQKLLELAELGVLYLPANLFFSEGDREVKNRRNTVRVSLSNAGPEKIRQAAEITRDYLTS